jgi:hypothetical protein
MPGTKPACATPGRKRTRGTPDAGRTNIGAADGTPHVTRMRAIRRPAPTWRGGTFQGVTIRSTASYA